MSRPKLSEMERIRGHIAVATEAELMVISDWIHLLLLSKNAANGTQPKRNRRKADAQLPLAAKVE